MSNSIREKLGASQGGQTSFVKLPTVHSWSVAEDEDGNIVFKRWDKTLEKNILSEHPLEGIYIGGAMKLSAFDDNLGSSGGNYFSSHYVNKENIVLFRPGKKIESVAKGNIEVIEKWIATNTTARSPRKKWCFFVLTEDGLIEIQSNITIAIDQLKRHKEAIKENYAHFTPSLYDETSDLTKSCKEMLGKFAKKNPPKYAYLQASELISIEDWEGWEAEETIKIFAEWKKQKASITTAIAEEVEETKTEENKGEDFGKSQTPANVAPEINDDLPF